MINEAIIKTEVDGLRKAAKCVFLDTDEAVAMDLVNKLNGAADTIEMLQGFGKWMAGREYDSIIQDTYNQMREGLVGIKNPAG